MSGLPGGEPGATRPNWIVNAWNSARAGRARLPVGGRRGSSGARSTARRPISTSRSRSSCTRRTWSSTRPAIRELVERTGATHIGVELDASHLFWQWMDPVAVVQDLGPLVVHAAAKDVKINPAAAVYGVLDNRFRRLGPDEPRTNLGGDEWANEWPKDAAWDFVALGRGHDAVYWSTWLAALYAVDPDMLVNIEHEDVSLGRIEGLEVAAGVLLDAARRAGIPSERTRHYQGRRQRRSFRGSHAALIPATHRSCGLNPRPHPHVCGSARDPTKGITDDPSSLAPRSPWSALASATVLPLAACSGGGAPPANNSDQGGGGRRLRLHHRHGHPRDPG